MTEKEICAKLYEFIKEGEALRLSGGVNPHPGNTLAHMLSAVGWVHEDLRQALMVASPSYGAEQRVWMLRGEIGADDEAEMSEVRQS